jgi:DNA polymerase-1
MTLKPFAFDTETGLIKFAEKAPPLVCVSYADLKNWNTHEIPETPDLTIGLLHHTESEEHLKTWFTDPKLLMIGANTSYDAGVVMQRFPKLAPYVWDAYQDDRVQDIFLRQRLIDIAQGTYWALRKRKGVYSLKGLTKRYFDIDLDKGENTWRMRYIELIDKPIAEWPADAKTYAKDDAEATTLVWLEQEKHFAPLLEDSCRQARAGLWIHLMTAWGMRTDQRAVAKLARAVQRDYDELEKVLLAEGLLKRVGKEVVEIKRDTKAAKALMIDAMASKAQGATEIDKICLEKGALGDKVNEMFAQGKDISLTAKGQVALDKDSCEESGDIALEGYAELTHLKTLLGKDIKALSSPEVHPYFEVILETGRTSASNPNTQNPARTGGIRECYIPRPCTVFIDADYDIVELRTFAQICLWTVGYSKLAEALNAGYDPHLSLGAQLIGISYEEAVARKRDKDVKDARQYSKPANFGFPGGMGATKFRDYAKYSYGVDLSLEEATSLRDTWFNTWPEARDYFKWVTDKKVNHWYFDMERKQDACRILQFVANRWRGGCTYTESANGRFQGLASDIAKAAGFLIARECYDESLGSVLFGCRIVNFIHDQFLVETFEENAHECAQRVGYLMTEAAKPFLPDIPATCTPCLASCWSKGAEAVYDTDKRLMVWEPVFGTLDEASRAGDALATEVIQVTKTRHAAWFSSPTGHRPPRFSDLVKETGWEPVAKPC